MSTVRLIATKDYTYAGRSLKAGDPFEASEKDANLLTLIGNAKEAPTKSYRTKVSEPPVLDESQDVASPSKRKYLRRDLVAET